MPRQTSGPLGMISAAAGLVGFSVVAGVLVTALVTPTLALTSMAANSSIGVFEALPDYLEIGQLTQRNTLYAKKGDEYVPFAEVFKQNRQEVSWDQISPWIKDAVIAGEDRRFYDHGGVDLQGIIRAALSNVATNDIASGASTITMQLIKNVNIQNALHLPTKEEQLKALGDAQAQTLDRKLKEAKLAIGLEKKYTKNQILLAYLNIVGFGGNTYGIESAAQQYLSKSAADVTLVEAASLAAIVQLPNDQNLGDPKLYPANKDRRDFILGNMLDLKMITEAQYTEAVNTPVESYVKITKPTSGCANASAAKTFCDFILKSVKDFEMLGATPEERQANWDRGGYSVYTTIDLDEQAVAEKNLRAQAPPTEKRFNLGASAASIQVGTGRILIMAQNKYFDDTGEGDPLTTTAVNFNTDQAYGGSFGFPVGSTYKIFTTADWLINGHGLGEIVNGSKHDAKYFRADCVGGYVYNPPYSPRNDDSQTVGPVNIIQALAQSINAAFISMAEQLDQCEIASVAKSMGAHRADGQPLLTSPAAILGVNEIAPLSMAAAAATVAGKGMYCTPIAVDKIVDTNGNDLGGQDPHCHQAITPEVAAGVAYAMQAVMNGGLGVASNPHTGVPLAGKTGTTSDSWHTWMLSTSTKTSLAVWVGNIKGHQALRQIQIAGGNAATARHRIARAILYSLTRKYGGGAFPTPPANLLSGVTIAIPDMTGKTPEEAKALLESLGFTYADGGPTAGDGPIGTVAKTDPVAGTKVSKGYQIKVFTSDGTLYVEMPNDLIGQSPSNAKNELLALGFFAGNISINWVLTANPGEYCRVTDTNPPGGSGTSKQAAVTLSVGTDVAGSPPPGCFP
ncbi:MAG: transglycosylase domain-containing protein [Cryobacterium sp.]|nr:transglycosylase domain-containing protein [Cryobacterium sp.]MBX3089958.1 transglycosylase domain-containing protein [Cryobacterium sp.]MCO5293334.1 transglycosylase domain-containing protein [Homoserinimonas sp.]